MKLPGRMMAGRAEPAGVFFSAPPRPGPSRTRDPLATQIPGYRTDVPIRSTSPRRLLDEESRTYGSPKGLTGRGPICQLLEEGRTRENRQNSKFPQSFVWEFEMCASGRQNSRESGGEMTGRNGDDGALAPRLLRARGLAALRRPARRTAVRVGPAARGRRGVCGGRVGVAGEPSPQRDYSIISTRVTLIHA